MNPTHERIEPDDEARRIDLHSQLASCLRKLNHHLDYATLHRRNIAIAQRNIEEDQSKLDTAEANLSEERITLSLLMAQYRNLPEYTPKGSLPPPPTPPRPEDDPDHPDHVPL